MQTLTDRLYITEKEIEYSRRHEAWECHWFLLKHLVRKRIFNKNILKVIEKSPTCQKF